MFIVSTCFYSFPGRFYSFLLVSCYSKCGGYRESNADGCIYIKLIKKPDRQISFATLAVDVDDIIPVSNDISMLNAEKESLCRRFEMVDKGEAHHVLGMSIKRDRKAKTLFISQPKYVENVLQRFGMEDCKPVSTPMEPGKKFQKLSDDEESFDTQTYQQAMGCLAYASTATRSDIAAAVGTLSRYMANPSKDHWMGVKRILRYLKRTLNYGFSDSENDKIVGFADADWAGDVDSGCSISGYVFQIGSSTVSWCSRKQATVAKSTTEAEYVSLSLATQEAVWLRRLMNDLGNRMMLPTLIYEDNQGAIQPSRNPKFHNRTKHIDVCYHFVRERVTSKEVGVDYCPTQDMVADIIMKGLRKVTFEKFRNSLGVYHVV